MEKRPADARRIALIGILGAMAVIALFSATMAPTGRLSFYALSSVFVSVVVIEYGVAGGWLFYTATSLLSLILIPSRLELIPYFIFFGLYGIVKFYAERLNKPIIEYTLKILFFNLCLAAILLFLRQAFSIRTEAAVPLGAILIALEIAFVAYDYAYTLFIRYYRQRLRKYL